VKSAHVKADYHLKLRPGTNVALINALARVIVTYKDRRMTLRAGALRTGLLREMQALVSEERDSPETTESVTGVDPTRLSPAAI
jgi:formate dehydrogenase major subunit